MREKIEEQFPDAPQESIQSAYDELEDEGPWVDFRELDDDAEPEDSIPTPRVERKCEACGQPALDNIQLVKDINAQDGAMSKYPRYYLPNSGARMKKHLQKSGSAASA